MYSQVFKELPVATALGSQDIQVTGYPRHMCLREKNKIQENGTRTIKIKKENGK